MTLQGRLLVAGSVLAVALTGWLVLVEQALGMDMGGGTGLAALGWLIAFWTTMTAAMMLPSAAPTLLLYARVIRSSPDGEGAAAHVYAFAGGYLLVWTAFSLFATVLQRMLASLLLLTLMMEARDRAMGGALLIVAGIYQLTPFKRTCLESCRSPPRT